MERCVLIYNPISGHGHLDSWNAIFVSALLEKGWRILVLTPDVSALMTKLEHSGTAKSTNLHVLNWGASSSGSVKAWLNSQVHTIWWRWAEASERYYYCRPGSEITPEMSIPRRVKRRFFHLVIPILYPASQFVRTQYRRLRRHVDRSGKHSDDEAGFLKPVECASRVRAALKASKWKPSLVFNMYIDMYKTDLESWKQFHATCSIPWAGVRFVPHEVPIEGYYRLSSLRGMCFLDERVCSAYRKHLPRKYFEFLPDVTDAALPEEPSPLTLEIMSRAAGRKIVFLGGSIGGQKNLARWYELLNLADPRQWFFVQLGELHESSMTSEDRAALKKSLASPPENLFLKAEYLPDERLFNDVISASDVLFAVYRDFKISSNMASKAASFRKPILVSDRYIMGDRVTKYGIGLAVSEDDARNMHEGLISLTRNPIPLENYARFCADFSTNALAEGLHSFLKRCVGCTSTH